MGMMDKLLNAMRLNPDEDFDDDEMDEEYDFDEEDDDEYDIPSGPSERELRRQQAAEDKAAKREMKRRDREEAAEERDNDEVPSRSNSRRAGDEYVFNKKAERQATTAGRSSKITPINGRSTSKSGGSGMAVRIIKPTSVDDEVEIVDTLLDGRTVIINMEGFDVTMAQRIIDFTIGATYAMGGDLQRISSFIFLATPKGVDISGGISSLKDQYSGDEEAL